MDQIVSKSPNNYNIALLDNIGEIRFGPPYYSMIFNDICFEGRIFGDDYLWSQDSKYFAIQEWKTIDYNKGPQTQLIILDVDNKKECIVSTANKGFIVPKAFESGKIIYTKKYKGRGVFKEFEMNISSLEKWVDI